MEIGPINRFNRQIFRSMDDQMTIDCVSHTKMNLSIEDRKKIDKGM